MYNFIDVTETSTGLTALKLLPEAVSINGQYIEEAIEGYRTLYTEGREALAFEINEQTVGTANGSRILSTRYPSRTITVGFQLIADNPQDFRTKFNHLNNLLSAEEADFVFHDEEDKFFTGTPLADIQVEPGRNAVTGEWYIYCADPFKYSTEPIVVEPTIVNDTSAEFVINYAGTYPAKPVLQAEFAGALEGGKSSEDGDCGFVAFMDADENIIQIGNPEAVDLDELASASTPVNQTFTTIDGTWATSGTTYGNRAVSGSLAVNQAITDVYWASGRGQTLRFARPSSYGSGSSWHGPMYWKPISGGANFEISAVHRMCCSAVGQLGSFELSAYTLGSPNKVLAGIVIDKSSNGNNATVRYIVNGNQVGSATMDLSYYNKHFGYCMRTAIVTTYYYNKKKKKWQTTKIKGAKKKTTTTYTYTQSNLNINIAKTGNKVSFRVGNMPAVAFTVDNIEFLTAGALALYYGQYGSVGALHTNATNWVRFVRQPGVLFADIPNVFLSGDLVEADTSDASITIRNLNTEEGHFAPQYGALGNSWEDFALARGTNQIKAVWSDWVNPNYKPRVRIIYNEVYI